MKLLIRVFGMVIVGVLFVALYIQYFSTSIREIEMHNALNVAMTQTQSVMSDQIRDKKYGTNTATHTFNSASKDYESFFIANLEPLMASDTDYTVDFLNVDYDKGILDVELNYEYRKAGGTMATGSIRKTGIVDITSK